MRAYEKAIISPPEAAERTVAKSREPLLVSGLQSDKTLLQAVEASEFEDILFYRSGREPGDGAQNGRTLGLIQINVEVGRLYILCSSVSFKSTLLHSDVPPVFSCLDHERGAVPKSRTVPRRGFGARGASNL